MSGRNKSTKVVRLSNEHYSMLQHMVSAGKHACLSDALHSLLASKYKTYVDNVLPLSDNENCYFISLFEQRINKVQ